MYFLLIQSCWLDTNQFCGYEAAPTGRSVLIADTCALLSSVPTPRPSSNHATSPNGQPAKTIRPLPLSVKAWKSPTGEPSMENGRGVGDLPSTPRAFEESADGNPRDCMSRSLSMDRKRMKPRQAIDLLANATHAPTVQRTTSHGQPQRSAGLILASWTAPAPRFSHLSVG